MGTVLLEGDAHSVRLKGEAGAFGPGPVPPGTYNLWANFDGTDVEQTVRVQVSDSATVRIECTAGFQLCKVR